MAPVRSRQRRRFTGLVPRLGHALGIAGRWVCRHPQPFLFMAALTMILWGLWSYGERAEAFRIAHVYLPSQSSLKLRAPLIGTNLWALDIRTLAEELQQQQPWLKEVRVVRQLPNAIRIDAIPRMAVAQVRLDRWYPVDRDGFILPQASAEPSPRLIRLEGFERSGTALRIGKDNADERLQLALRILAKLRRAPPSISRRLVAVNVADPRQIRFLIVLPASTEGPAEVRCGSEEELEAHLQRLSAALKAVTKEPFAVRYIDVRFHEPVVGPRT